MSLLVQAGSEGNRRFGLILRQYRISNELNTKALAEKAGVHVSFVRGIERGAQSPSLETAKKLFSVMRQQTKYWISWPNLQECDLIIRDLKENCLVTFKFKAKVKGQHVRPDVENKRFCIEIDGEIIEVLTYRRLGFVLDATLIEGA